MNNSLKNKIITTTVLSVVILLIPSMIVFAQTNVNGYVRSDGQYVAPYQRSAPDSTTTNNYGSYRSEPSVDTNMPNTESGSLFKKYTGIDPDPYDSED